MTDRTPLREEDITLAAEYALGVLQGPERQAFEKRLAQEPALAKELRQWDERFIGFADDIAAVPPPPQIWAVIDNRLFAQQNAVPQASMWNSLAFWRGLALASVVAVAALAAWNLRPLPETPQVPALIAQVAGQPDGVKLAALYDGGSGELRLNRVEGAAAQGRSLELWLIAGDAAPVSLGVLPEAATALIIVPDALRAKLAGGVLAVSDEPPGGSPTGAPTGAVLATGQLTKV